jgi:tetratricopeptide (TPR) repeat protein
VVEPSRPSTAEGALGRLQQASDLLAAGRPELAEKQIRTVLASYPNLAVAHALMGMVLASLGQGTQAIDAADQAIRLDPNLSLAHTARFRALRKLGFPWEAELEASRALELDPDEPNRMSDLAEAMMQWGRYDEALAVCLQGLRLNPRHLPNLHVQALTLVFLGRVDEARATLGAALVEAPSLAALHAAVGLALEEQGDLRGAEIEYREALRLDAGGAMAKRGLRRTTAWYARVTPSHVYGRVRRRFGAAHPPRPDDGGPD